MTNLVSRHPSNDDPRHFVFERNSRLPLGTFPRGHKLNFHAVVLVVGALGAAAMLFVFLFQLFTFMLDNVL